MSRDLLEKNWEIVRNRLREKWEKLSESDVTTINGDYNQLSGVLQDKYGAYKEDVNAEINQWLNDMLSGPPGQRQTE